jgi:3-methyladenine DNA glycosylase/8-oxoguanine DNA glycosylase
MIDMVRLTHSFSFDVHPIPPYSFKLTVKKPAGWSLFNPSEVYGAGTLWTTTYVDGTLVGVRLSSKGTVKRPKVNARVFSRDELDVQLKESIMRQLRKAVGADQNLEEFYKFAVKDSILKHVIQDLYGMHDTFSTTIFSESVLAILLQMAPLKRSNEMMASFIQNYGEKAEFDGKKIKAWPTPKTMEGVSSRELARRCKVGYRAKSIVKLARRLSQADFPTAEQLEEMDAAKARELLLELPGIGDYSADIINPHGGFPIDVWSAEVFGKLFFGKEPENNREAVERVKKEGLRRWGRWSWMAFFYIVQDLENLSKKTGKNLRLT